MEFFNGTQCINQMLCAECVRKEVEFSIVHLNIDSIFFVVGNLTFDIEIGMSLHHEVVIFEYLEHLIEF